jgi:hypothetical protein
MVALLGEEPFHLRLLLGQRRHAECPTERVGHEIAIERFLQAAVEAKLVPEDLRLADGEQIPIETRRRNP